MWVYTANGLSRSNAAVYYPETITLIPLSSVVGKSHPPAYKSVAMSLYRGKVNILGA
jgi:hypothetical protein